MTCTVCSAPLLDEDEVFSEVTGSHKYLSGSCVEGSAHRHESCAEAVYDDSPAEMGESLRKGRNMGGF